MAQIGINILNRTITDNLIRSTVPPDSLSVRLTDLEQQQAYVKIHGIAWGLVSASEAGLTAFDFGVLQVIRNEIFDGAFVYGEASAINGKDVIFEDVIIREQKFNYRDFAEPLILNEASNYLIVMSAPRDLSGAGTAYESVLTVRGEFCKREIYAQPKQPFSDLKR